MLCSSSFPPSPLFLSGEREREREQRKGSVATAPNAPSFFFCETKHPRRLFSVFPARESAVKTFRKNAEWFVFIRVYVLFWVSKISLGTSNMKWLHARPQIRGGWLQIVARPRLGCFSRCSFLQVLLAVQVFEREKHGPHECVRASLFPRAPCGWFFFCCAQNASLHMECASMQSIPLRQSRLPKILVG